MAFISWTDLFYVEVVDPVTGKQVPHGEVGALCVTRLWTNHATPFLRRNSGDLVRYVEQSSGSGPYAELFPMIKHANRTTGFFKIRGVNGNHAEFEDLMFRHDEVTDFQGILHTEPSTALEQLLVLIEVKRGSDPAQVSRMVAETIKRIFEVTPVINVLQLGSLAAEFEKNTKVPRFVDRRV